MNTKSTKVSMVSLLFLLTVSCDDSFLDRKPLNIISSDAVFSDKALTEAYLYTIYNYMPSGYAGFFQEGPGTIPPGIPGFYNTGYGFVNLLDGNTDLARSPITWGENNSQNIPGIFDATNNLLDNWGRDYEAIRKANNLIFNLGSSQLDEAFKTRIIAEARFVRAFMHFDLVRRYGDVPLIKELQSFDDLQSLYPSRTPSTDVYDFIDQELSVIADELPSAQNLPASELGRATREACWALNGRALLFSKKYARSAEFSKKVMDEAYFVLNPDYNAVFQSYGGDREVIFEVRFDGTNKTKGHFFDAFNRPFSLVEGNGFGSFTNPTQELVDSYEMLNGKGILDPTSGYDPQNPYINRDKRFEATILHHGSVIMGMKIDVEFPSGKDAPGQPDRGITGYYIRKFLDEGLPLGLNWILGQSKTSWKELRYGEVLLNYAEAQNEAVGPDASVYTAVNQIRSRAGLPDLPGGLSKDDMFSRIVQERKIELAFEGHRFWDLKRWEMGEAVLNGKYFSGIKIQRDPLTNLLTYNVFSTNTYGIPKQVFLPKHYLMPLPQAELQKNTNLTQNPGY